MIKFVLFGLFPLLALGTEPAKLSFDSGKGKVSFLAVGHPSAVKVRGEGSGPKGELQEGKDKNFSGTLDFDLNSLKTGIQMRDEHMKTKYLKTGEHPVATLKIIELKIPSRPFNFRDLPFSGTLSLNGEIHAISGKANLSQKQNAVAVEAEFPLKLGDFKIALPTFAGITVADDVTVNVDSNTEGKFP